MTRAARYMERVAAPGCVVCRRVFGHYVPAQVHHIAEGSSPRSDFAVAPLCEEHHTGESGFHRRGRMFLAQFRVPGETEWGLLQWVNEDLAK